LKDTATVTPKHWNRMKLGYTGGEEISVMGSLFPENYDGFRTELLEILGDFLEKTDIGIN